MKSVSTFINTGNLFAMYKSFCLVGSLICILTACPTTPTLMSSESSSSRSANLNSDSDRFQENSNVRKNPGVPDAKLNPVVSSASAAPKPKALEPSPSPVITQAPEVSVPIQADPLQELRDQAISVPALMGDCVDKQPIQQGMNLYISGSDPACSGIESQKELVGTWRMFTNGINSNRSKDINTAIDTANGVLFVTEDLHFVWAKHSGVFKGRLQQVFPRSDAKKGVNYWRFGDTRLELLLAFEGQEDGLSVINAQTHLYALSAERF